MATFDVAKLLNKITQDIPGINTVLKALAKWDVSALTDVPDGAMQATTDTSNRLTIRKKVSGSYTPVAKLMHDVDTVDGYHASASATANTVAVRNAQGALPGNVLGNAATADTATALAAGSVVPVNQGGTGATTASQARANLGVAGSSDFTSHIAKQASPTVEGHIKLDVLAADGSNTAAPGGFGLGKTVGRSTGTKLNNLLEGGFYSLVSSPRTAITDVAFPDIGNGTMLVIPRGNETIQLFFCSGGWAHRRYNQNTATWGDFIVIPHGITDSTNTTSSKIAASATSVKEAYDRAQQVATASISGGVKVGGAISSVSSAGEVTLSSATTTSRGISRVATLADMEPGAVVENGPAFLDSELLKTAPPSGTTLNTGWIGTMLCNTRTVITTSGTYTHPTEGWVKITCIGGGGAGGSNGNRGGQGGGTTSFGTYLSALGGGGGNGATRDSIEVGSGGGAAGLVSIGYVYLVEGTSVSVTIGAGGQISTTDNTAPTGDGISTYYRSGATGYNIPAPGARGAGNGTSSYTDSTGSNSEGGCGGSNGTGFGGGGGGSISGYYCAKSAPGAGGDNGNAGEWKTSNGIQQCNGGNGGNGAIILEYFNPAVTA